MKILVIYPRPLLLGANQANYNYAFPLGLGFISAVLKQAGHTVDCLNINHYPGKPENVILNALRKNDYDIACTGGQSTIYHIVDNVVKSIRKFNPKIKIILGGPIVTVEPELMFESFNPDFIVISEGDKTITELVSTIENKGNLQKVAGICYKNNNGEIVVTKKRDPIMDLDSLPLPDYDGFEYSTKLDNARVTDNQLHYMFDKPRVYPLLASRSCPHLCTFCFHPLGTRYRQRSVKSIIQELEIIVPKYKINMITAYDELFVNRKEKVVEFCNAIKEFRKKLKWELVWACFGRVDTIDEELLSIMKDAGLYSIFYGLESISPKILKSMRKKTTPEQIDKAIHMTLDANLALMGPFILGDIEETVETAHETLDFWIKHEEAQSELDFIRPYPGCEIYWYCIEKGIIKDKLDYLKNHVLGDFINMSKHMTNKQFNQLLIDTFAITLKYWRCATPLTMKKTEKNIYEVVFKCPHCKQLLRYGNLYIPHRFIFFIHMTFCRKCHRKFFMASKTYVILAKILSSFFFSKYIGRDFKMFVYNFERRIRRPILRGLLSGNTE